MVFCAFFRSSIIRNRVIPHAVSFFTGELAESDDHDDTEDEEEEEEEDEVCEKKVKYSACFYK